MGKTKRTRNVRNDHRTDDVERKTKYSSRQFKNNKRSRVNRRYRTVFGANKWKRRANYLDRPVCFPDIIRGTSRSREHDNRSKNVETTCHHTAVTGVCVRKYTSMQLIAYLFPARTDVRTSSLQTIAGRCGWFPPCANNGGGGGGRENSLGKSRTDYAGRRNATAVKSEMRAGGRRAFARYTPAIGYGE